MTGRFREVFQTRTEDMAARHGQPFRVIDSIESPDHPSVGVEVDIDCLPMYRIRFPDGSETHAFPEEVLREWDYVDVSQEA